MMLPDEIVRELFGNVVPPRHTLFAELFPSATASKSAQYRLPAIYEWKGFADAGGLMSFGPNPREIWRRSAALVDKVLKGTKPADLPVELPTKYEFVINLKTAKALGLTIPPAVLARADAIIQ